LTAGLSADFVDGTDVLVSDQESWNPKLGLVWRAAPGTVVRAAAFKVLKRSLVTDQTLEPTQVAGFNQFFDDVNAAKSWRYGLGVDQKFGRHVFGGAEFSKRDLDSPFTTTGPSGVERREENRKEYLGRAYAYWTPHPRLGLRSEYIYEKFDNELLGVELPRELTTHRVPLGVSVFHPSGLSGGITATYIKQDGEFDQGSGSDKFWLLDVAARYRLPRRYGILAVGVRNVTDEKFRFFDIDTKNPRIAPDRMAFIQLTLALP
jgi:outer membrane receptor protein involved in Fe transport